MGGDFRWHSVFRVKYGRYILVQILCQNCPLGLRSLRFYKQVLIYNSCARLHIDFIHFVQGQSKVGVNLFLLLISSWRLWKNLVLIKKSFMRHFIEPIRTGSGCQTLLWNRCFVDIWMVKGGGLNLHLDGATTSVVSTSLIENVLIFGGKACSGERVVEDWWIVDQRGDNGSFFNYICAVFHVIGAFFDLDLRLSTHYPSSLLKVQNVVGTVDLLRLRLVAFNS